MNVSIVIYVLNELEGLRTMMPRLKKEWCSQLLVIDGGSTDGSVEFLRENGYEVYRQAEPRWAGAYMEAYRRATGDIIVDFSPDGNSIPEKIPELIDKVKEGYDLVVASRYAGGAHSEDDTAVTRLGNFMFTWVINLLFRSGSTDSLVIFRAYRRSFLERANLLGRSLDQCVTGVQVIRSGKIRARYAEVPADEPLRLFGVRKMNILLDGLRVVSLIVKEFVLYDVARAARLPISF